MEFVGVVVFDLALLFIILFFAEGIESLIDRRAIAVFLLAWTWVDFGMIGSLLFLFLNLPFNFILFLFDFLGISILTF